jgi:hypothetical protein
MNIVRTMFQAVEKVTLCCASRSKMLQSFSELGFCQFFARQEYAPNRTQS